MSSSNPSPVNGTRPADSSADAQFKGLETQHSTPSQAPSSTPHPHDSAGDSHTGRVPNPRSCITCRKRKVRCDKNHPCANCVRAHIECVYPGPGRAPRRPRKPKEPKDNAELLLRLRRLEGVVKGMGVEVGPGHLQSHDSGNRARTFHSGSSSPANEHDHGEGARSHLNRLSLPRSESQDTEHDPAKLESRFGRLVVSEGRSRYVNTSFWASLSNEVEDLKGILNEDSGQDDDEHFSAFGDPHTTGQQHGWLFSFNSQSVDMLSLHPHPAQVETYWSWFRDRVDPLVKILHVPTIEPTILAAASHLSNLSKAFEALLFSIYYGAVTSASSEECVTTFGEDRARLLSRYRFGVEQALARAHFLTAQELVILQAFIVYMMCLRRNSDGRVIWTLTGLLVRMAQNMGLHRDGTHFDLPIFEIEMRRRIWWQICLLESRSSEDQGCDPTIVDSSFDTKMPLNINDSDISVDSTAFPAEHQGCTDLSFSLIRIEVASVFRRLNYSLSARDSHEDSAPTLTFEEKERLIKEAHERLESKYLRHCDMTVPLYWVTATVARLIMSKMWIIFYHPFQRQTGEVVLSQGIKDKLFLISLENIEYAVLLETETRTMKWGWLFRTYMQWHALAFLLQELCVRTRGPLVERAWIAIGKIRQGKTSNFRTEVRAAHLWRPLNKLLETAQRERQNALDEDTQVTGRGVPNPKTGLADRVLPGSLADMLQQGREDSISVQGTPTATNEVASRINRSFLSSRFMPDAMLRPERQVEPPNSFHPLTSNNPMSTANASSAFESTDPNLDLDMSADLATNDANFLLDPTVAGTGTSGGSMSLDANGELDWANFDNMVRQFGMDSMVTEQNGGGQGMNWTTPNRGVTPNTPGLGGVGTGDWF